MSVQTVVTNRASISGIAPNASLADIDLVTNNSTVIGYLAGKRLSGRFNTVLGYAAARFASKGHNSTIIGYSAGFYNNGARNVFLGGNAGYSNSAGDGNVFIGNNSGYANKTGSCNLFLGTETGLSNSGNNNTYVGGYNTRIRDSSANNTSLGFGSIAVGGGATALGFLNWNFGAGSITAGNGLRNYGKNSLIMLTPNNRLPNNSNALDNYTNIQNMLLGSAASSNSNVTYTTTLQTPDALSAIILTSDGSNTGATISASNLTLNGKVDVADLNVDTIMLPKKNPLWKIHTYLQSSASNGSVLALESVLGQTVISWLDDFEPGVLNFTGKHRCLFSGPATSLAPGMVLVATGEYRDLRGRAAVCDVDEAIPVVALSSRARQSSVFGVVGTTSQDDVRSFKLGNMRFENSDLDVTGKIVVQSVGEGAIAVCDGNGDVRNGDLLCTSDVPGYAMRQGCDIVRSYTAAKATCDYSFSKAGEGRALIGCVYKF